MLNRASLSSIYQFKGGFSCFLYPNSTFFSIFGKAEVGEVAFRQFQYAILFFFLLFILSFFMVDGNLVTLMIVDWYF